MYALTQTLRSVYSKNEQFVQGSKYGYGIQKRRILLELARQTKCLHGSGDVEINPIINCSEAGEGSVKIIVKNDLKRITKLLETLKTLNRLICVELASKAEKHFRANNSAQRIDAVLSKFFLDNSELHQSSTVRIGDEIEQLEAAQIRIDLLCLVLQDFEHNQWALRGVIDSQNNRIEDEIRVANEHLAAHNSHEPHLSCLWWDALKCASGIVQHEIYATIVRLSDVEDKFQRQIEQKWTFFDNQLQENPKQFDRNYLNSK